MKKLILILFIVVGIISCEKTEAPIFAGDQTLVYFPNSTANLDVVIDDVGSVSVQINTTTLSEQDRTVTLEIVDEDTTVDFQNVDIPSLQVTIPANEYFGAFVVNGIDNTVETSPELLTVRIVDAGDDAIVNARPIEIRVRQVCPIEDGLFTGPYLLEQVTPIHPENGILTFETQVLDVEQGGGNTERTITANYLEAFGIGQPDMTIPFDLSCNDVVITSDQIVSFLQCAGNSIFFGSAPQTGNYDPEDDSSFNLIVSEYVQPACGVPAPISTEFNLTKQ